MLFLQTALISFCSLFLYACIGSFIAWRNKKGDIADVFWGGGFVLVSLIGFSYSNYNVYNWILLGMILLWAIRLSTHIYIRNRKRKEDFRYQNLRDNRPFFSFSELLGKVFLLQGFIQWMIGLMLLWIFIHAEMIESSIFLIALSFWILGFALETIADWQLSNFMKIGRVKAICKEGLWKYSRHPNFLGEILQWWSIFLIACFLDFGYVFIFAPMLLTYLIVFVSGIAPIETKMKEKEGYYEYQLSTPCLVGSKVYNGLLYTIGWVYFVYFGPKETALSQISVFMILGSLQIAIFYFMDRKSFLLLPFSVIYSLVFGLFQQLALLNFDIVKYEINSVFPPLWLVALYPLFGLTFFSSCRFLFSFYTLAFFIGGLGGFLSYLTASQIHVVEFLNQFSYIEIFFSWAVFFTIMTYMVRKLEMLYSRFVNPLMYKKILTVFFDTSCPVCNKEKCKLEKRNFQSSIVFQSIEPREHFESLGLPFSYNQAMSSIHAIEDNVKVYKGIDALSELYARTDLKFLAIFLQAPFFNLINRGLYKIWAKSRFLWKF